MAKTGYLKRYRNPIIVIRFAVILHMFLPSRIVSILLFLLFKAKFSYKTVCGWTNKFADGIILPSYQCTSDVLICHADEKYVKVGGEWHYWWSIKDCFGNLIHCIVTPFRDFDSAKKLLKEARRKIDREVDVLVRDGLYAYQNSTKFLGRRCKSVIAGIKGKGFIYKKKFYWITNNPAESLNSEIDSYLEKFRYNFETMKIAIRNLRASAQSKKAIFKCSKTRPALQCGVVFDNIGSANRFAQLFMLRKHLKKMFYEKKLLEASSMLEQAFTI